MRIFFVTILVAMTALADATNAAESLRYTHHFDGYPEPSTESGRVIVDGDRYRVERDPDDDPRPYDVTLTEGGGAQALALNLKNKTFFDAVGQPGITSPLYLLLPIKENSRSKDFVIEASEEDGETLAGYATRKWTLHFSYRVSIDFHGERITGTVHSTVSYWLTDQVSLPLPPLLRPHLQTGFGKIDQRLAEELATLKGFPLKQRVSVTRQVSDGDPDTATRTKTIESIEKIDVEPTIFVVPPGFTYQEPQFAGPAGDNKQLF